MPLIDRFRLDDVEILKWKCPLCSSLCPTYNSLIGHLVLEHTEGTCGPKEVLEWAKMMAEEAEPRWVPRKQLVDKEGGEG